jgi:hypothetical protein
VSIVLLSLLGIKIQLHLGFDKSHDEEDEHKQDVYLPADQEQTLHINFIQPQQPQVISQGPPSAFPPQGYQPYYQPPMMMGVQQHPQMYMQHQPPQYMPPTFGQQQQQYSAYPQFSQAPQ